MKQSILVLVVACGFYSLALSQDTIPKGGPANADQMVQPSLHVAEGENNNYVIGPGDVLSIVVFQEDQFTTKATVRGDGMISFLLLDEVQASGKTPRQLKETITEGLKKFLNDPQVFVIPLEIKSQVVYVVGNVTKPGVYPLLTPLRVAELLVVAGGLAEYAKADQIVVILDEGKLKTRYPFNYKTFQQGKNFSQNIPLRKGDMVIIP